MAWRSVRCGRYGSPARWPREGAACLPRGGGRRAESGAESLTAKAVFDPAPGTAQVESTAPSSGHIGHQIHPKYPDSAGPASFLTRRCGWPVGVRGSAEK